MNGKNQIIARIELLIMFKKTIINGLSNSNKPHSAMFMLKRNPSSVSQIPLLAGCDLINLKIKIGAIKNAIEIDGTKLLSLVNMKIKKPSRK